MAESLESKENKAGTQPEAIFCPSCGHDCSRASGTTSRDMLIFCGGCNHVFKPSEAAKDGGGAMGATLRVLLLEVKELRRRVDSLEKWRSGP